jgi:hypothetical protein
VKLVQTTGNGTIKTPDWQSIARISSSVGRSVDGRWVYYGILLFNNTQSKSLSFLNNSLCLSRDVLGNGTDRIWLLNSNTFYSYFPKLDDERWKLNIYCIKRGNEVYAAAAEKTLFKHNVKEIKDY